MGGVKRQRFKSTNKCTSSDDCDSHDHATNKKLIQQNSNSSESFKLIPQDLMFVILSLVPLKCLLNSARYVCKPWATAIQACLRSKPPGLYVENIKSTRTSYFLNIQQDHVNGSQSEMTHLGTPSRMGRILATCDGILLLHSCRSGRLTFAVNPILKCCFRIPPLPTTSNGYLGYRSTIARVPRTTKFKLFFADVLNDSGVNWYVFYVLRIGIDNTWKEIARKQVILINSYLKWEPVYSGYNDIYWITKDGVIVMHVDHETIIREYPLPPPRVDRCPIGTFLWMGDRLSCIVVVKDISKTYQVYTLDLDLAKWTLYHEMGPFDYVATCGHEIDFDFNNRRVCVMFLFWINDLIIFLAHIRKFKQFSCLRIVHFCYNVKTRQLTKIEGIAMGNFKAWLHTNTLVSLPSTPT